jgi:hypothetical protein
LREVVGFAQELLLSDWKIGKARPLRDANYAARDWPVASNTIWGLTSAVYGEVITGVVSATSKDFRDMGYFYYGSLRINVVEHINSYLHF